MHYLLKRVSSALLTASFLMLPGCGPTPSGPSRETILREELRLWESTRLAEVDQGWALKPESRPIGIEDFRCRPKGTPTKALCYYERVSAAGTSTEIEGRLFVRKKNRWSIQLEDKASDAQQ